MTLAEIIAKIKEAAEKKTEYDPSADIQGLVDSSVKAVTDKNTELLGKNKALKAITDTLPEDFSIEDYNKAIELAASVDTSKLKVDEQVQTVRDQLTTAHAAEMTKLGDTVTSLRSALEGQLIDNAATTSINTAKGNGTLLLPHVRNSIKMIEEEGKYRATVVDAAGNERFSITKPGEKMGIDELVGEFKVNPVFAGGFAADNSGGGTPPGGTPPGGVKNPFKGKGVPGSDYNITEQAKLRNTQPEVAKQMEAEAAAG